MNEPEISPTLPPTKTQFPPTMTSTPTLAPTNTTTPTPTMTPEPTSTYAPVVPIGEIQGDVFFRICDILGLLDENNKPIEPCPIIEPESLSGDYRSKFLAFSLDYNWPQGYGIVNSDVRESPFCDYDIDDEESSCGDYGLMLIAEGDTTPTINRMIHDTSLDSYLGGEYALVQVTRITLDSLFPVLDPENHSDETFKEYILKQMRILWPLTSDQHAEMVESLLLYSTEKRVGN
jgi:hypothetical protein